MKVLCACEESQAVCKAFRALGHEAYSCDLQEPSGGRPEWHVVGDAVALLDGGRTFKTMDGEGHRVGCWDMVIAFPPCTYMTNAGAVRMMVKGVIQKERWEKAMAAKAFFMAFYNCSVPRIAIENPVPMKRIGLPPYDQIIQPWMFGHGYSKRTCLWLKGLPALMATDIVTEHVPYVNGGSKNSHGGPRRFQGRRERDPKVRSKTFPGIAKAMAEQWGRV